jgi:hypothetical protein
MPESPLLDLDPGRVAAESRRAAEREEAMLGYERKRKRLFWQCVALSLTGVPVYALSWQFTDPLKINLAIAGGFFLSYALPFFRWLAYHVRNSEEFAR